MARHPVVVLTVDQRRSRSDVDRVPEALDALATGAAEGLDGTPLLAAERTAGDELQTVYASSTAAVLAVERLTRLGGWRIGVGLGDIDHPLPTSTRAGRGAAYLAARDAITSARTTSAHLAVRMPASDASAARRVVGGSPYCVLDPAEAVEHALTLLVTVLAGRSVPGWEIVDLVDQGLTGKAAAARLGISESAVSQRLSRARHEEGLRARALAVHLMCEAGVRP